MYKGITETTDGSLTHGKAKNITPPTNRNTLEAMKGNCLRDSPIIDSLKSYVCAFMG